MAFPYNFSTVPADLRHLAQALQANFRKAISGDSFTAAGDLLVGTGAGQYAKVAAGATGSVLTADSTQPGLVAWKARGVLVAQNLGTSGFFATSYSNISTPSSFAAISGQSYLVTLTGYAIDGTSGATRNSDFRFFDGTSVVGSVHTFQTINVDRAAVCVRAVYAAASTASVTIFPQAQCVSGTPAVQMGAMTYTVEAI